MPDIIDGARYVQAPRACGVCLRPFQTDDRVIVLRCRFPDGSEGDLAIHDRLSCRAPVGRYMAGQGRTFGEREDSLR